MALKKRKVRNELPTPEMNITSLMDVLTTLIFFIVMMAGFNQTFVLQATPLTSGKPTNTEQKPVFTLKVAVLSETTARLWLGPVEGLSPVKMPELEAFLKSRFSGNSTIGFSRALVEKDSAKLLRSLQEILAKIKISFPHETKAVVAFADRVSYQTTVNVISSVRSIPRQKPPVETVNLLGKKELTRVLFPELIISEWSEEI